MHVRLFPTSLGVLAILFSGVSRAQVPPPKSSEKSVTVYPVVLTTSRSIPSSLPERLAEVVGTFLERVGTDEVEIADKTFPMPENGDVTAVSSAFGKFVRDNPPTTSHAVLGQVVADGQSINEIRTVIVDRSGKVVFSERADQRIFRESKADEVTLTVYPVHLWQGWDQDAAQKLASQVTENGVFKAEAASATPTWNVKGDPNQLNTARAYTSFGTM